DLAAPFVADRGSLAIVYSASHGQIAADGTGKLSPFAEATIRALQGTRLRVTEIYAAIAAHLSSSGYRSQTPSLSMVLPDGVVPSLSVVEETRAKVRLIKRGAVPAATNSISTKRRH
ncbi:MAG: hypothetical protein AAF511_10095, partial [Pseudomonadota bacterium]